MSAPDSVVDALRGLAQALGDGVGWAVVGGLAVSARAEPRFTRDVDLVVAVAGDEEAERVVAELGRRGWSTWAVVEQQAVDRLAQARLRPTAPGQVSCDLLFASSGIEPEIVQEAERLEIVPDLVLPVASVGHLIALKLLSTSESRRQDELDLAALAAVAAALDWALAAAAVRLITDRGFARERDLTSALSTLRAQASD